MDAVREAGWTRFKHVKGQPIEEKDMRKVFKLVDLDKDGSISRLVSWYIHFIFNENHNFDPQRIMYWQKWSIKKACFVFVEEKLCFTTY